MSRIHGWTALALAGAAVALCSYTAVAAAAAPAAAATSRPALAIGAGGGDVWRLEGRMLTVTLRRPLAARSRPHPRYGIWLRCGDGAQIYDGYGTIAFATDAQRTLSVPTRARILRARLGRDVAARANWCELVAGADERDGLAVQRHVPMRLRRGPRRECAPARNEQVVARSPQLLLTGFDDNYDLRVFRSCLRPYGPMRFFGTNEDSGGASGSYEGIGPFAVGGTWAAWGTVHNSHWPDDSYGGTRYGLRVADLGPAAGSGRPADLPLALGDPAGVTAAPTLAQLKVAANGTVVWIAGAGAVQQLNARVRGRAPQTVATAADGLTDLAISPDGGTVSWLAGGVAGNAAL